MQLENSATLITGASEGLGRALAVAVARAGARVALNARRAGPLAAVVDAIRAAGGEAHAVAGDVGDVANAGKLAARAAARVGPLDLVVHNASTLGAVPLPVLLDTDPDELMHVLAVNVVGPFALTRALAGSMLVRGGGTIVQISSDAAVEAYPRWGAYGALKAAADHLARIWAAELAGSGVRFLAIDPGEMDTAMHAAAIPDADRATLARPEAVADAIVALLVDPRRAPSGARLRAAEFVR